MKIYLYVLTLVFMLQVSASIRVYSQDKQGRSFHVQVLDEDTREGIQGVTLRSENGQIVRVTIENGYTDLVLGKEQLPFIFLVGHLGYREQELKIDLIPDTTLIVLLSKADNAIEEVVLSTGMYSLPKERATGSFTYIDQKEIAERPGMDLIARLEGVANGLQLVRNGIDDSYSVRIRGVSTIESNESPLIVLDGFVYEGELAHINPNDIQDITLLKDAAAASIWGARAGNGVIVIRTKKGHLHRQPILSANISSSIVDQPDFTYNRSWLPSREVMGFQKEMFEKGAYRETVHTVLPEYIELLIQRRDGLISDEEFSKKEALLQKADVLGEASKHLYRPAVSNQYAASLRGGSGFNSYYYSLAYHDSKEEVIGNSSSSILLNLSNEFALSPYISLSLNGGYSRQNVRPGGLKLTDLAVRGYGIQPYTRLLDENGNQLPFIRDLRVSYLQDNEQSELLDWYLYPLEERNLIQNRQMESQIKFDGKFEWRFLKSGRFNLLYQIVESSGQSITEYDKDSYFVRDMVNRFTQADYTRIIPHGGILESGTLSKTVSQTGRVQVNFDGAIAQKLRYHLYAGTDIRERKNAVSPSIRTYNYSPETLTGQRAFDYNTWYPARPSGSIMVSNPHANHQLFIDRYFSWFGNGAVSYEDKYVLSSSLRWDGSNLFGVKANQKGTLLASSGVSWDISKENFFSLDYLNLLKARVTYGSSGNVNTSVSHFPTISHTSGRAPTFLPYANVNSVGNPNLKWEKVKTLNLGLDFSFHNGFIRGSFEYYLKYANDLIGEAYFDPTTGINNDGLSVQGFKINYANMMTRGVDLNLDISSRIGRVSWSSKLLFSYTGNEITKYNTPEISNVTYYLNQRSVPPKEGVSKDIVYAYPWYGLSNENGLPLVKIDGDYSQDYTKWITTMEYDDLLVAGVNVAPYFGSVSTALSWRNVGFHFLIGGKFGHVFRRQSISSGNEYARLYHTDYYQRWQKPGDELLTNVPAATPYGVNIMYLPSAYLDAELLVESASYIQLQEVGLRYSNNRIFGHNTITVFASVRNLGILWAANEYNIHPEYHQATYAPKKRFNLGLNLSF